MTRQLILIIAFLISKNIFCQTDYKLIIGELTITQSSFDNLKVGDTLDFLLAKKHFVGSIKVHSDNSIYTWTTCILGQKKYSWCKIGTWEKNEFVVFKINCNTITLRNITTEIGNGQQRFIVRDIN